MEMVTYKSICTSFENEFLTKWFSNIGVQKPLNLQNTELDGRWKMELMIGDSVGVKLNGRGLKTFTEFIK